MQNTLAKVPRKKWFLGLFIILMVGLAVYHNSFFGEFIFDDAPKICNNSLIRKLFPPWDAFYNNRRPILYVSLAFNYAWGQYQVWTYHVVNLAIHIVNAMLLFNIVRHTLLTQNLRRVWQKSAHWLALTIALIWLVHPLHTQSVTYIIQRAESLSGLFYLLTMYCSILYLKNGNKSFGLAAVLCCALGLGTKEVVLTAPLLVIIYDRIFISRSFSEIAKNRLGFYLSLAGTWGITLILHTSMHPEKMTTAGFDYQGISVWHYALTQPSVIGHYLKLSVFPYPLIFDYNDWPVARGFLQNLPANLLIISLFLSSIILLKRAPRVGFLGISFFLILAPSSSFIPIADLAFEYRMYLALIPVITLIVMGADRIISFCKLSNEQKQVIVSVLVFITIGGLGKLTIERNNDYRSEFSIWQDTVRKRPNNPRARTLLGAAYFSSGKFAQAKEQYQIALKLNPTDATIFSNLGLVLAEEENYEKADHYYRKALNFPSSNKGIIHNNFGLSLARQGKYEQAIEHYRQALKEGYFDAPILSNYGIALARLNRFKEAETLLKQALQINPEHSEARSILADVISELQAAPME